MEALETQETTYWWILRFSFCFTDSRFVAEEACNQETPRGVNFKKSLSLPKGPRKKRKVKKEISENDCSTLGKHHRKKQVPSCQQRASVKPRPTPLPGDNGALQSTHVAGLIPEKTKLGPGTLSLLSGKDPPLCSVNGDHMKSLDFHLCFVVTWC